MNSPFNSKTLLVFGGHVGAHPDGHQHGAFTESVLLFWVNNFLMRGSFYINLIHFSDSGIYRFIFIFASVTMKTSHN